MGQKIKEDWGGEGRGKGGGDLQKAGDKRVKSGIPIWQGTRKNFPTLHLFLINK